MNLSHAEIADRLSRAVGLAKSLVGVNFFDKQHAVPAGLKRPDKPIYYCTAVSRAFKGESLLMLPEDHSCARGAYALGVSELPDNFKTGEPFAKGHMVADANAGKKLIDQLPRLIVGRTAAISMMPLEKMTFEPDVVIASANSRQALQLLNATSFDTGLEIPMRFQIFMSFCAYATAWPFISDRPNATFPQGQARKRTELTDEEIIVGFPFKLLPCAAEIIEGMCCIAPKQKEEQ
jgi:uncharacterized protein (DUF169 family)